MPVIKPSRTIDTETVMRCLATNERGDAALFALLFNGQFLFDLSAGEWLVWQGHHWERDLTDQVNAAVESVAERYEAEIPGIDARLKSLREEFHAAGQVESSTP